jgi:hypothetical protein
MIYEDSYNASEFPGIEDPTTNLPSDSSLLPAPVGIIEIFTLFGLAACRKLMGEDVFVHQGYFRGLNGVR